MDRTPKVLQAAARDAAARARLLAEALDALADAADTVSEVPQEARPALQAAAVGGGVEKLWTVADVARFLGASESWVRHATASGRLPCTRMGGLLRFQSDEIRALTRGGIPPVPAVLPRKARQKQPR